MTNALFYLSVFDYLFIEKFIRQKFVEFSMQKTSINLWKIILSKIFFGYSEQNILCHGSFVKSIDSEV